MEEKVFLTEPALKYKKSFCEMVEDYRAANDTEKVHMYGAALEDFEGYVQTLHDHAKGINLPNNWVPSLTYWLTNEKDDILGVIRIRTSLAQEYLLKIAGHIGYDVPIAHRRKGYGKEMLRLALPKAKAIGLDSVLISCNTQNIASAKIIESNGGEFEYEVWDEYDNEMIRRYWIHLK